MLRVDKFVALPFLFYRHRHLFFVILVVLAILFVGFDILLDAVELALERLYLVKQLAVCGIFGHCSRCCVLLCLVLLRLNGQYGA